jgi:hypothetical protein
MVVILYYAPKLWVELPIFPSRVSGVDKVPLASCPTHLPSTTTQELLGDVFG